MIGERLKEAREAKGLTQQQLAERMNLTKQTISNWENNSQNISQDHVIEIARILTCSLDYLYGFSKVMYIGYNKEADYISLNGLNEGFKENIIGLINEYRFK